MEAQSNLRIKLEIYTPVEKAAGCVLMVATIFLLLIVRSQEANLDGFLMIAGCILHWIFLLKIYRSLRVYYILDLGKKALVKHTDLLGFSWDWGVTQMGDIVGVGVVTHRTKRREIVYHGYTAVLGTSNGKLVEVTDTFTQIDDADLKAKQLAQTIGCVHLPGKHRQDPRINPTTRAFEYNPGHDFKDLVKFGKLVATIPFIIYLSTPLFLFVVIPPYIPKIIFRSLIPEQSDINSDMAVIQPGKGLKDMVQIGDKPATFLKKLGQPLRLDKKGPKDKPFWRIYYYKGFALHCYDTTGWAVSTIDVKGIYKNYGTKLAQSYSLPSKIGIGDHRRKLEKLWGAPDTEQGDNFLFYYQRGLSVFLNKKGYIAGMTIRRKLTKDGKPLKEEKSTKSSSTTGRSRSRTSKPMKR